MISNVPAAARLVHFDAARSQRFSGRENVRPSDFAADAERQHVRMLEEQQRVGDSSGAAIFDQRPLQGERIGVRHGA